MARAIDSEAAYRFLSEQLVKETGAFSEGVNKGLNIARSAMRNPDAIPTLTPPNEPMALEQLRQMDGEPVWDENGKCYLVDTTYRFCSCSDIEIAIVDKNGDVKRYPQRRALYRRPPEGEGNT